MNTVTPNNNFLKVQKNVENIILNHVETTKETSQKILKEIKIDTQTYGEAKTKLRRLKKTIMYRYKYFDEKVIDYVFENAELLLNKETNDLPLTNRSK